MVVMTLSFGSSAMLARRHVKTSIETASRIDSHFFIVIFLLTVDGDHGIYLIMPCGASQAFEGNLKNPLEMDEI